MRKWNVIRTKCDRLVQTSPDLLCYSGLSEVWLKTAQDCRILYMYTYQAKSNSMCYLVCIWPQPKAVSHHGVCIPEQGGVYKSQKPQTSGIDWTAGVMCGHLKRTAFLKEYGTFIEENDSKWKLPMMGKKHASRDTSSILQTSTDNTRSSHYQTRNLGKPNGLNRYANILSNWWHYSFDINSGDWVKDLKQSATFWLLAEPGPQWCTDIK